MDKIEFVAVFHGMHWYATGHKNRPSIVDSIELRPVDCENETEAQLVAFFEGKDAYKITVEKITRKECK